MIPARKHPLLDRLLHIYVTRLARGTFHAIHVSGWNHLRQLPTTQSTLAVANHTNWWDGFLIFLLTRSTPNHACYCMMEEKQLQHYGFLTWIGAFSINLEGIGKALPSLRYTLGLLKRPGSLVWMFPQGTLTRPGDPIIIRPGALFLLQKSPDSLCLPVAFHYGFGREQKPEAYIHILPPLPATSITPDLLKAKLEEAHQTLHQRILADQSDSFEFLLSPKLSINKRWEKIRRLVSGRMKDFQTSN